MYSFANLRDALIGEITPGKGRRPPRPIKLGYATGEGQGEIEAIPLQAAMALFDAGMTICVPRVDRSDPKLAELAASVRRELQFTGEVEVNCYYSPDRFGFGWHYDCQHVFILQIDGSKAWHFTPTRGLDWPPFNLTPEAAQSPEGRAMAQAIGVEIQLPVEEEVVTQMLNPGDVLYLPPGTWHRASAAGHSMALTLTLYPVTLVKMLRTLLTSTAIREVSWRRDIHACHLLHQDRMTDQLTELLDDVRGRLAQTSAQDLMRLHADPRLRSLVQLADTRVF